jgi:SAM-dependent methyltransferase
MPGVEANRRQWDGEYAWPQDGEEWSAGWGGADAQWHYSLRPRLRRFLPAATILEIAPGYGRWTQYLIGCCDRYIGVDLSARGVDACRVRFGDAEDAEFHVNDGKSLPMVEDTTIDLAFSFDSLVHAEEDVIAAYLSELARVLRADGVAFMHHSNLAGCRPVPGPLRLALRIAERATRRETPGFDHWRGTTMSARRLEGLAAQAGLACIGQEVVNWLGGRLIDCMSLLTPLGSRWERPNVVVHNPYFMAEAASTARAARLDVAPVVSSRSARAGSAQHLGSLARIVSRTVGPWGVSVEGPLPARRRQ